jgi:dihydroneopterin aldolase
VDHHQLFLRILSPIEVGIKEFAHSNPSQEPDFKMDSNSIFLKDMQFMLSVGTDAWQRTGKVQPVHISLRVDHIEGINEAAGFDNVSMTLDYGKLYKKIQHNLEIQQDCANILEVAEQVLLAVTTPKLDVSLEIDLPKAILRAEGGFRYTLNKDTKPQASYERVCIRGIKCACLIGVNPHERRDKQILVIDLAFRGDNNPPAEATSSRSEVTAARIAINEYHKIVETVVKVRQLSVYIYCFSPSELPEQNTIPQPKH